MHETPWPVAAPAWPDGATVWSIDLDMGVDGLAACATLLSSEEHGRADRFVRAEDRHRFVASHAALRIVLGRALGASPRALAFTTGPSGKPELSGGLAGFLHFNLSHSGNRALVGLARVPIGVDLEAMRPITDHLRIARHHFHPDEVAAIAALPHAARQSGFYACWTRKEAFVKAVGAGLSMPLDSFAVSLPPVRPALLFSAHDDHGPVCWSLHHLEPADGYIGAVAIAQADAPCARFALAPDWPDHHGGS